MDASHYIKSDQIFCGLEQLEKELMEAAREVSALRAERANALLKEYLAAQPAH